MCQTYKLIGLNLPFTPVEHHLLTNYNQQVAADDSVLIHQLDGVAEEFESIKQVLLDRGEDQPKLKWPVDQSPLFVPSPSDNPAATAIKKKRRTVHDYIAIYEDDFQTLKSRLLQPTRQLRIIPIIGKSFGMGKRTLALRLYNDASVAALFYTRACISVALEYDVKVILLNLLEGLGNKITKEMRRQSVDELGIILRKFLMDRKYCILIHNVENEDVWSKLRRFFPENRCGSRILYTGFERDFEGKESRYGGEPHMLRFLRDDESWLLFCQLVFRLDHCPVLELEPIGKDLVGCCNGHTQTIALIGGLFATSEMNPSFWELVAQVLNSALDVQPNSEPEVMVIRVLCLIYNHLPYYLKSCLLYMVAFTECCDIRASNIIKLWIAEGFVKKCVNNTLEDTAKGYLSILIDKGLLHLSRQGPTGRVKAFEINPLLRALYGVIARKEKFAWSKDLWSGIGIDFNVDNIRRLSGRQLLQPCAEIELLPESRSFLSTGNASPTPTHVFVGFTLLRVLAVFQLEFFQFPAEILHMFLLRYLAFSCHSNTPASIYKLWNLQTLTLRRLPWFRAFSLPIELLEMEQLIHLKCKETFVWNSPKNGKDRMRSKLQTLSNLQLFGLDTDFFDQIPNIRKLGIYCNIAMHYVLDLTRLHELETLKCSTDWSLASKNFLSNIKFPSMLRKVTFTKCRIPSGFMKVVGALSSLEELKLQRSDFLVMESGLNESEWEPTEGEYSRLISLVMKDLNLVHWKAHANHFPRLQQLIILNCYAMLGLPEDIGDIQTLELIHVNKHSPSVVAWALKIKEKHSENLSLEVRITKD